MKRYSVFQKHKRRGNMTWYGRISENGLFHVISLGTKKKADAIAWLDLMNAQKFLPEGFASDKERLMSARLKLKRINDRIQGVMKMAQKALNHIKENENEKA